MNLCSVHSMRFCHLSDQHHRSTWTTRLMTLIFNWLCFFDDGDAAIFESSRRQQFDGRIEVGPNLIRAVGSTLALHVTLLTVRYKEF